MLRKFAIACIDHILIYSPSLESHVEHIKQILFHLLSNQLYVKGEKVWFPCSHNFIPRYIIIQEGIAMDEVKVSTVTEWPTPQTVRDLQQFLGFANFYRCFIQRFQFHCYPSHSSPTKGPQEAVLEPWMLLSQGWELCYLSASVRNPSFTKWPFLRTKHSHSEQNFDIRNRELLAVKLVLEEWWQWLEGTVHPFSFHRP